MLIVTCSIVYILSILFARQVHRFLKKKEFDCMMIDETFVWFAPVWNVIFAFLDFITYLSKRNKDADNIKKSNKFLDKFLNKDI
jgi:hypothetical protein